MRLPARVRNRRPSATRRERSPMESSAVPGLAYVDHIGISVPDLNTAVSFFCSVLGATELYRSTRSGQGDFMRETFDVDPEASFELCMLRVPPNLNLELFL